MPKRPSKPAPDTDPLVLAEIGDLTTRLASGPQRRLDADRQAGRGENRADLTQAHSLHLRLAYLQALAKHPVLPAEY